MALPKLTRRQAALVKHDLAIFAAIFLPAALDNHAGLGGLIAAAATALKVLLRTALPVPPVDES